MKKLVCEFLGTLILVLFGCGVAVFTEADVVATSLAFGLSIVMVYYSFGSISGCNLNPAVSFALFTSGKMKGKEFIKYVIAQVLGALVGAVILAIIINNISNLGDFKQTSMGVNSYGNFGVTMLGAFITETILTFVFVLTVLKVSENTKYRNMAGIIIGLSLMFVHLLGIKITGTSVNPARSLGVAIISGVDSLKQVWVFIIAPLFGSSLASLIAKYLKNEK